MTPSMKEIVTGSDVKFTKPKKLSKKQIFNSEQDDNIFILGSSVTKAKVQNLMTPKLAHNNML